MTRTKGEKIKGKDRKGLKRHRLAWGKKWKRKKDHTGADSRVIHRDHGGELEKKPSR